MSDVAIENLVFQDGLLPVVVQDAKTQAVIMFAWMNLEALRLTVATGEAVYWSRSRQRLWKKGEESGCTQDVVEIRCDCDADVLLLKVKQQGGMACHTGRYSCFYRVLDDKGRFCVTDPVLKDPQVIYKK